MDSWQQGLRLQVASIMLLLQHVKEDLGGVGPSAVEHSILRADDHRVSQSSEVNSKLFEVISSKLLVENFRDSINCLWVKRRVNWSHGLGEILATKNGNGCGHEECAFVVLGNIKRILGTSAIDRIC